MRARIAWLLVGVSVVGVVVDTWITAVDRSLMSEATWARHGWPFATLATVSCSLMGALIVSRYPRHPIGWLLCVTGLSSISLATEAYGMWGLHGDGPGTDAAAHWAGWVSLLFGAPLPIAAVTLVFLVAPDGRLLSPRWRWAARASVLGLVLYTGGVLTIPPGGFDVGDQDEDYGLLSAILTSAGILLLAAALVAGAVSVALRLRRAQGEVRRQLLWIAASATLLASGFLWILSAQLVMGPEQTLVVALPLFIAYFVFPICTAVAVLRHRLFDIDLIVNRALVVALATGLVAAGYVFIVVGIGSALGDGAGGFWPSLLATAVVAMAFQPLRRGVVRLADRLAFGASAAPYEALADFSRRLGESPDPSRLLTAVADAAGTTVGARRASVRLPVPGGPDKVATWPHDAPDSSDAEITVSVIDRGETLGTLCIEMPPGRALRVRDSDLLQDLADQSAIAFRNARLSAELAQQVEQLAHRTQDLAESKRRLITAGDAERSRLERAIARQVSPHLEPLPDRLSALAASPDGTLTASRVEPLVAAATAALEALREITRGVFPAQLARSGLEAALGSLLGRDGTGRLVVAASASGRRPEPRVEAAAYFCVAEAARDLDLPIAVEFTTTALDLRLVISGGEGGLAALAAMRDRVETAGGTVGVRCTPGHTVLDVVLPAGQARQPEPARAGSAGSAGSAG